MSLYSSPHHFPVNPGSILPAKPSDNTNQPTSLTLPTATLTFPTQPTRSFKEFSIKNLCEVHQLENEKEDALFRSSLKTQIKILESSRREIEQIAVTSTTTKWVAERKQAIETQLQALHHQLDLIPHFIRDRQQTNKMFEALESASTKSGNGDVSLLVAPSKEVIRPFIDRIKMASEQLNEPLLMTAFDESLNASYHPEDLVRDHYQVAATELRYLRTHLSLPPSDADLFQIAYLEKAVSRARDELEGVADALRNAISPFEEMKKKKAEKYGWFESLYTKVVPTGVFKKLSTIQREFEAKEREYAALAYEIAQLKEKLPLERFNTISAPISLSREDEDRRLLYIKARPERSFLGKLWHDFTHPTEEWSEATSSFIQQFGVLFKVAQISQEAIKVHRVTEIAHQEVLNERLKTCLASEDEVEDIRSEAAIISEHLEAAARSKQESGGSKKSLPELTPEQQRYVDEAIGRYGAEKLTDKVRSRLVNEFTIGRLVHLEEEGHHSLADTAMKVDAITTPLLTPGQEKAKPLKEWHLQQFERFIHQLEPSVPSATSASLLVEYFASKHASPTHLLASKLTPGAQAHSDSPITLPSKILDGVSDHSAVHTELEEDLQNALEKFLQASEIFTHSHAEVDAHGKEITKEYMGETVNRLFDDFAAKHEDETGIKVGSAALERVKRRILEAAIDQHIDNPLQYVSHGFDHSLRVMEHVRRLLKQTPEEAARGPPEAVKGLMEKYGVGRAQVELLTQLIGVCHDFGYPTVGDLSKSLHAVTGTHRFLIDIAMPLGEAMGLDLKNNVRHIKFIKNFANSIECHSADKVESEYEDTKNDKQELKFDSKIRFRIKVPGTEIFYYQEFLFMSKDEATFRQKGAQFFKDNFNIDLVDSDIIVVHKGDPSLGSYSQNFEGRYIDAPGSTKKNKIPAGIEFRGAELSDKTRTKPGKGTYEFDPLLALVRYADNLDMDSSRLSPFQRSTIFTHLYERLGAARSAARDKTLSTLLQEQLVKSPPSLDAAKSVLDKTTQPGQEPVMYEGELLILVKGLIGKGSPGSMQALRTLLDSVQLMKYGSPPQPLSLEYVAELKAKVEELSTDLTSNVGLWKENPNRKQVGDMEMEFQGIMNKNIFRDEKANAKPDDLKYLPQVEKYLNTVNEISFRHFGGCNPIEVGGVKLRSSLISIGIKLAVIRRYKGLSIEEKIPKPGGKPGETEILNIPVSAYQLWRAVEAYESVTVYGQRLKIELRFGDKTFTFDPNGRRNPSGEFLEEYKKLEEAAII